MLSNVTHLVAHKDDEEEEISLTMQIAKDGHVVLSGKEFAL